MPLAAVGLGLAIGLVIGALGGGGSVLAVPALVHLLGLSAQAATTASLVIVGVTCAIAAVGHARHGRVRWRDGLLLAAAGVPASLLFSLLNQGVDENLLLLVFAAVMVIAATGMLVRSSPSHAGPAEHVVVRRWFRVAGVGVLVGALTGFLGVGGGFVVVPALVLVLRFPLGAAVGTSLLVITLNAAVALTARLGGPAPEWEVIVPFTAAAVVAALLGERVAGSVQGPSLARAFAVLLLVVAAYVGASAALGLA
jgi:uncharacterized protein